MEAVLLRVEEAAEALRCSRSEIYRLVARGELRTVRIGLTGRGARIPAEEIKRWVQERMK